jgi:hypothetical protein
MSPCRLSRPPARADQRTPSTLHPQHCLKRSPPGESRFGDFEPSHRIAIYDELPEGKMKIVEMVSQSDVLRALLRDKDALGAFPAVRTVEQLFGRKDVLSVPSDMPAIAVRLHASLLHAIAACQCAAAPSRPDEARCSVSPSCATWTSAACRLWTPSAATWSPT